MAARRSRNTASASSCTRTASPATSLMDYGDFSMTGKLVNLKLFDVKPEACNQ